MTFAFTATSKAQLWCRWMRAAKNRQDQRRCHFDVRHCSDSLQLLQLKTVITKEAVEQKISCAKVVGVLSTDLEGLMK